MNRASELKLNDVCRVKIDWTGVAKGKRARIIGFQDNNGEQFARVLWLGKQAGSLEKAVGVLFSTKNELKKIGA